MPRRRSAPRRKYYERVSQACDMCRRKKVKCDQGLPCQTCLDRGFRCTYGASRLGQGATRGNARDPLEASRAVLESSGVIDVSHGGGEEPAFLAVKDHGPSQPNNTSSHLTYAQYGDEGSTIGKQNMHTGGTEFYGNSSNFALLKQLCWNAHGARGMDIEAEWATRTTTSSLVDVLYDDQSTIPDPIPCSPVTAAGRSSDPSDNQTAISPGSTSSSATRSGDTNPNIRVPFRHPGARECFVGRPMKLEMEYVGLFFDNIHVSLPFLVREAFIARCEREVWTRSCVRHLSRSQMHFFALYNAVLATSSLTASKDAFDSLRRDLEVNRESAPSQDTPASGPSSMLLSKLYFWRARYLLGDQYEVCSIDGAQTLLLMSLYCQHALKPHASYMYSGMAVRTALAVGLPNSNGRVHEVQHDLTATRTWWCIYFQDIESSCSSGRFSTLADPGDFEARFDQLPRSSRLHEDPDDTHSEYNIVPALVTLSAILRQASNSLYLRDSLASFHEKSRASIDLDRRLLAWRSALPDHLNFDLDPLTESGWAVRQKLALQFRFHYARMFIHRPFLSASEDEVGIKHMKTCLAAARKTVGLALDAYRHRHYFRTCWHNAIYVLYASLIILHAIILSYSDISGSLLARDMRDALEILGSMRDLKVTRQCANLVKGIFDRVKRDSTDGVQSSSRSISTSPKQGNHEGVEMAHSLGDHVFGSGSINQVHDQELEEAFPSEFDPQNAFPAQDDILTCFGNLGAFEYFAGESGSLT